MKRALLTLVTMFISSGLWAFSGNVCEDFIPDELLKEISHLEKDGACYIDNKTDINILRYDKERTMALIKGIDPDLYIIPLFMGKSRAFLVNSDTMYALQEGNEQKWNDTKSITPCIGCSPRPAPTSTPPSPPPYPKR